MKSRRFELIVSELHEGVGGVAQFAAIFALTSTIFSLTFLFVDREEVKHCKIEKLP